MVEPDVLLIHMWECSYCLEPFLCIHVVNWDLQTLQLVFLLFTPWDYASLISSWQKKKGKEDDTPAFTIHVWEVALVTSVDISLARASHIDCLWMQREPGNEVPGQRLHYQSNLHYGSEKLQGWASVRCLVWETSDSFCHVDFSVISGIKVKLGLMTCRRLWFGRRKLDGTFLQFWFFQSEYGPVEEKNHFRRNIDVACGRVGDLTVRRTISLA